VATPEHLQGEGEFRNAELLSGPNLVVPPLARNRRVSGIVKLEATISKEGIVTNVVVVSGHPWLTEAAKQAILARRYRPATLNGQPVEVKIPIQVVLEPER
jgi:protein TonB